MPGTNRGMLNASECQHCGHDQGRSCRGGDRRSWITKLALGALGLTLLLVAVADIGRVRSAQGANKVLRYEPQGVELSSGGLLRATVVKSFEPAAQALNANVVADVFKRHCDWDAPESFLHELAETTYAVPLLVQASAEHCANSALPYTSVDVWYHHADVRILVGSSIEKAERELNRRCNDPAVSEACVIFMQTDVVRSAELGATLLLRVLQQPFVLISANNIDECAPYKSVPRPGDIPRDVDDLIRSPLLIRWYAKNMCLFPGHTYGKLVTLPLGPKWQWRSTAFDGEEKEGVKKDIVSAGATDPRSIFRGVKKEVVYVAMDRGSTDHTYYVPNVGLRDRMIKQLEKARFPDKITPGRIAAINDNTDHAGYMRALAESAFTLAPAGRGLDTHRLWEALAVGTIPITVRDPLSLLYNKLPVIVLDDLNDLTPEGLQEVFEYMREKDAAEGFDWNRVTAFYWLQHIVYDTRRKAEVLKTALGSLYA